MKRISILTIAFLAFFSVILTKNCTAQSYYLDTTMLDAHVWINVNQDTHSISLKSTRAALREWSRINQLLSEDHPKSEIRRINLNAGFQPVKVPDEVFNLVYRAVKMARVTNGAFDITTGLLVQNYEPGILHSGTKDTTYKMLLRRTGYEKITLNVKEKTVFLQEQGMMISLGEMQTGYILNRMKDIYIEHNVMSGQISIDRQVIVWGKKSETEDWVVAAPSPSKETAVLQRFKLKDKAICSKKVVTRKSDITTSYHTLGLHPMSGKPADEILGVTILCSDAEIAEVVAYSVIILGVEQGMKLINLLQGVEGIIVDNKGVSHPSANVDQFFVPWSKF